MRSRFVVATANLQNTAPDMERREVRRAAERLGEVADIIGFQEVREHQDVVDINRGLRASGGEFDLLKTGTSTPVAYRKDYFKYADSNVHLFNQASGRVPTPRRQAVEIDLRRKRRPGHPNLTVFNAHPINGAFNNNHRDTKDVRRLIWDASFEVFDAAVKASYADGDNIVILGDMNNPHMAKFMAAQHWVMHEHIDYIGVIAQPRWRFEVLETWEQNNDSDHNALLAHLSLRRG